MAKINKALDYNKLLSEQAKGKLLKKQLTFALYAGIKYDGNYVIIHVSDTVTFETSGGLSYTHLDAGGDIFTGAAEGHYFAERIAGDGKLGDRAECNLKGPKAAQTSENHTYRVFGYVTDEEYAVGFSDTVYEEMMKIVYYNIPAGNIAEAVLINDIDELNILFAAVNDDGYEGLMLMATDYTWKDTTSRGVKLAKYKKRPTADLLCVGVLEGEGKYAGLIGSLVLEDKEGRVVKVGSGLNDIDRECDHYHFINSVIEIGYEQILDTYIQPVYKQIRKDKQWSQEI